ncbi:hypothetical protein MESS4_560032 [Mesorhizobium sp. STM 4661]|nr:hypothetical protein MESS4_560032 [Mesorhizobium sp. STM 4661]
MRPESRPADRRHRLEAVRRRRCRLRGDGARPAVLRRGHAAHTCRRQECWGRGHECGEPADEPRGRPAGDQRGRPACILRIRRDLFVARPAQRPWRYRTRHERVAGGAANGHQWPAPMLPPDAVGRQARALRFAEPSPRHHQARRPGHHGLWPPRLAQRPRRFPGRGRSRASARDKRLCREAGRTLFFRSRRLVRDGRHRCHRRRLVERGARAHRRSVLRYLAQSRPPRPYRRMDAFADIRRLGHQAEVGHGAAGRHHSGDRDRLFHHQYRGRHRARQPAAARGDRLALPRSVAPHRGAPRLHDRRAGHPAEARGTALFQHTGLPAAVLAFAQQCDGRRQTLITIRLDTTYFRRTLPVREVSRGVDGPLAGVGILSAVEDDLHHCPCRAGCRLCRPANRGNSRQHRRLSAGDRNRR